MIVHLDTSALVDALTGPRRSLDALTMLVQGEHRLALSTLVLYEWRAVPACPPRCALANGASLWTLNHTDFQDIPDLRLV